MGQRLTSRPEVTSQSAEGVPGDTSPGLASQQLALTLDDPERADDPPSRLAARPSRRDAQRP
jgi:hypothetical protein